MKQIPSHLKKKEKHLTIMTYSERKEKERHLLYLIEQKRLTTLEKVANDFNCSQRTVKRMLTGLRKEGYNICYCRVKCKYYIEN